MSKIGMVAKHVQHNLPHSDGVGTAAGCQNRHAAEWRRTESVALFLLSP